jgi:glycosyltransferase involved in cell wall biosynthesis
MRIAFVNQFYKPDLAPTGHLVASLAEHRTELGDQVTVITSQGGYVTDSPQQTAEASGNLNVIRLWTPRLGKERTLHRIIDYAFFYIQAVLRFLFVPAQDVIVSLTTPPFIAWAGVLHKLLHSNSRLILWNMDSYPEVLERTGVISEGSLASRMLRGLNKALFKRLDYLICLDDAMCQLLTRNYLSDTLAFPSAVVPNWEQLSQFPVTQPPAIASSMFDLDLKGQFVVLYLGNAGFGHRFETVIEAAIALKNKPVSFLFVGGGKKWQELQVSKERLSLEGFHLRTYVPKEKTPDVMALVDCALITLNESALGIISPSKLHSNLAMSLPVIYIGPEGGNVHQAIERFACGISLRHGQAQEVVAFIENLRTNENILKEYQRNARRAFEQAYSDDVTLPQMDEIIDSLGPSDH